VNQVFSRFINKYLLGYAFQPARRNRRGDMVLVKGKLINRGVYIGFFIALCAFALFYLDEDDSEDWIYHLIYMGAAALFLGVCSTILACSKTVVSDRYVTRYQWYGRKTIYFEDIHTVSFTRFFGGCFVLKDARRTVWVPMENVGSAEFVELLCEKLGKERCAAAVQAIHNRKNELAKLF